MQPFCGLNLDSPKVDLELKIKENFNTKYIPILLMGRPKSPKHGTYVAQQLTQRKGGHPNIIPFFYRNLTN